MDSQADSSTGLGVYHRGIDLAPLAPFFDNFFMGEQEDAHEFFVALITKLEEEALWFGKRQTGSDNSSDVTDSDDVEEGSSETKEDREGSAGNGEESFFRPCISLSRSRSRSPDDSPAATVRKDIEAEVDSVQTCFTENAKDEPNTWPQRALCSPSHLRGSHDESLSSDISHDGLSNSRVSSTSVGSTALVGTTPWINDLVQGCLLNIIRCRRPGCLHHIVTQEPFINLSIGLNIDDNAISTKTEGEGETKRTPCVEDVEDPHSPRDLDFTAEKGVNAERGKSAYGGTQSHPETWKDVAEGTPPLDLRRLLCRFVRSYEQLEGYVCDACGSTEGQYQGGCFYGDLPPVLVLQFKRFAVSFLANSSVVFTKDESEVKVSEYIELFSLPEENDVGGGGYDVAAKRFTDTLLNTEREATQRRKTVITVETEEGSSDSSGLSDEECLIDAIWTQYRLQGTVLHYGKNLYSGHYVAEFAVDFSPDESKQDDVSPLKKSSLTEPCNGRVDVEAKGSKEKEGSSLSNDQLSEEAEPSRRVWKLANDEYVLTEPVVSERERERRSGQCYLLLYEKILKKRVRCPLWKVLPRLPDSWN
ncbi:unnamed protein product [Phytomonas sp. Hart1]|nr:unnamed protein product [Phytomonas sp. Hart1]|eukprot:CCW70811.1 unnamed protein product [Phytomonas sp. isolate Hart1]